MDQKQKEKHALDYMLGKEGTEYKSTHGKRWLKKFLKIQKNGCKPGEAFDFKTDKCKPKAAIFMEAHVRRHPIKALDKFGRVIDIPQKDVDLVAGYLQKIPNKERINDFNMFTCIGDFPDVARSMLKKIKEFEHG